MSRKRSRRRTSEQSTPWLLRGTVILILMALICAVSASLLGHVNQQKKSRSTFGEVDVQSLSAGSPSKEYVYAGSRLVATVEPSLNAAQFISMSYEEPCEGNAWLPLTATSFGGTPLEYRVRVTMKNTGSDEWPLGGNYFLGSQGPPNNETWGPGKNRIAVPMSVQPNNNVTFEFTVKKPVASAVFQWQMVQGPVSTGVFFGDLTPSVSIPGGAWLCSTTPAFLATFVSQSVPGEMTAGQTYSVSITMNNAGAKKWQHPDCKLGSQIPQDNATWGTNRITLPSPTNPGQNVTFTFNVTAPSSPGEYNFQWMMVLDSETPPQWFGYVTPTTFVKVVAQ